MDSDSEMPGEEQVDPRVKDELDALNESTSDINDLETRLSDERSKFKSLLSDATIQLAQLSKKHGAAINRARPYYDAMKEAKQANAALLLAVHNFHKSNGIYRAARETISLAEERLSECGEKRVDTAWQEMLNLQTEKFMKAETDRRKSERLHAQATKRYEFLSKKAEKIRLKHKKSTAKTKEYFDTKELLETKLQKQRQCVDGIQGEIEAAKGRYKAALKNLEKISTEIHEKRKLDAHLRNLFGPRDPSADGSEDDVMSVATDLDLVGPKSYDDLEDLENELNDFDFDGVDGSDEGSYSGSESDTSGSSSMTSSTTSPLPRRHSSRRLRHYRRQTSSASIEEEGVVGHKRKLRPPGKGNSIAEDDEVFKATVTNQDSVDSNESRDRTYDNLHGISSHVSADSTNRESRKTESDEDYDIFEDLCL